MRGAYVSPDNGRAARYFGICPNEQVPQERVAARGARRPVQDITYRHGSEKERKARRRKRRQRACVLS